MNTSLRFRVIVLAACGLVALGLSASVAFATPRAAQLLRSLVPGILVGAPCLFDFLCDPLTLPGGATTQGQCQNDTCCSVGLCTATADCCTVNPPSVCELQTALGVKECCEGTNTGCQQESVGGSAVCCNNYNVGAALGESAYNGGLPEACLPTGGGGFACQTCKENDSTTITGHGPNGINAVPLTQCCTGFADNIAGTNPGPEYCCSTKGQTCGMTVNAHLAYCCGSSADPTLHGTAPFASCSNYTHTCCFVDSTACVSDNDCCSGWCSPATNKCGPPLCGI